MESVETYLRMAAWHFENGENYFALIYLRNAFKRLAELSDDELDKNEYEEIVENLRNIIVHEYGW